MSGSFHLAQINVGKILGPIDSAVMAGFVALLPEVNALAEASPGFVWRLQTDEGNATSVHAFSDPMMLMNMSVWESIESLRAFTYQSRHLGPLKDRAKWFELPKEPHMALWWVPVGHVPSVEEGVERLLHRRAHGDTEYAFSFTNSFPAPQKETKTAEVSS